MPALGPFQCKDDHLMAFYLKAQTLFKIIEDYRSDETGYTKYSRDLMACLDDIMALSDLTLSDPPGPTDGPSDPPDPYDLTKFTERFCKDYEDRINSNKHLANQFLLPHLL